MAILKRLKAPKFWKIPRVKEKFVLSVRPSAHPADRSYPLGVVLRDMLKLGRTLKEVKFMLNSRLVEVNGRVRTDKNFSIGMFDIIHIKKENKYYVVLPSPKGLGFVETNENVKKLSKVKRKVAIRGGKIQLTFHDGETKLADNNIKTNDTVVLNLKTREIENVLPFKEGAFVMITNGENAGKVGKVEKIEVVRSSMPNRVMVSVDGKMIESVVDNVFVVGDDSPIEFPKVKENE